jgi:hypothetical protein
VQLCSCAVVQLCSCAVVQLCSCAVVQLCSCAVAQLRSCAVVQLCSCAVVWKTRITSHVCIVLLLYVVAQVGVGPADYLEVVKDALGTRGGIPFLQQPYLFLKDAGANILVADSTSYCTVSISNNPSGGLLSSKPVYYNRNEALDLYTLVPHTVQVYQGTVQFLNGECEGTCGICYMV